ncbi:hypothetical protein IKG13_00235 [Candidatus Saccharibacteria bacterium]|nr:hypothetical protein [Candidatus Saccharibacteria bacterium]
MKTKFKRILSFSTIAALGVAGYASAAAVPISDNPDSPQSVDICKTITNAYDNTTATFNYTFAAQSTGLTNVPSTQSIVFNNDAPTNHEVKKCTTVSLANVAFTDNSPKQVEVEVTETPVSGFSVDSTTYKILFDLRNTVDANDNITGQIATAYLHDDSGQKVSKFDFASAKQYGDKDITLTKTVKGNGGDVNKYFKFTANISGAAGTTYTVYGSSSTDSASSCAANTACVIYAKHGETIRIGFDGTDSEIPVGETYTITEDAYSDYTTSVAVGGGTASSSSTTGQQTISATSANNTAAFTNVKGINPPTGLFLNLWPYILLGAISAGAIIYGKKLRSSKK